MSSPLFYTRTNCRVCGSAQLDLVLDYGEMPLAGGFFPAEDERSMRRFPLHLVQCKNCSLLQVKETVEPGIIFENYSYESSVNRTLVAHFAELSNLLAQMAGQDGLIVEFGCNDGVLLNPLAARGARVVGVDPSDVAERASAKAGWPLVREYFDKDVAAAIRSRFGEAKVIAANNVCAHVDDPNVLIEGVAELLAPDGKFVFEVHYQGDLIEGCQYDTVYHEHTCYYSLRSLQCLLAKHQLSITGVERHSIHCGSIRVVAERSGSAERSPFVDEMLEAERAYNVQGFGEFARRHRERLHGLVAAMRSAGKRIAAYGASGRATILLNYCGLGPELLENVSDLSPLRYGRVVPGIGLPIVPRERFHSDYPDYALLTAWNYEREIVRDEEAFLAQGSFIVPLTSIRIV